MPADVFDAIDAEHQQRPFDVFDQLEAEQDNASLQQTRDTLIGQESAENQYRLWAIEHAPEQVPELAYSMQQTANRRGAEAGAGKAFGLNVLQGLSGVGQILVNATGLGDALNDPATRLQNQMTMQAINWNNPNASVAGYGFGTLADPATWTVFAKTGQLARSALGIKALEQSAPALNAIVGSRFMGLAGNSANLMRGLAAESLGGATGMFALEGGKHALEGTPYPIQQQLSDVGIGGSMGAGTFAAGQAMLAANRGLARLSQAANRGFELPPHAGPLATTEQLARELADLESFVKNEANAVYRRNPIKQEVPTARGGKAQVDAPVDRSPATVNIDGQEARLGAGLTPELQYARRRMMEINHELVQRGAIREYDPLATPRLSAPRERGTKPPPSSGKTIEAPGQLWEGTELTPDQNQYISRVENPPGSRVKFTSDDGVAGTGIVLAHDAKGGYRVIDATGVEHNVGLGNTVRATSGFVIQPADRRAVENIVEAQRTDGEQLGFIPRGGVAEKIDRGNSLVARDDQGNIQGYVLAGKVNQTTGEVRVAQTWVAPEMRRRGVGSDLLDELEARSRAAGATSIVASVGSDMPEAINFWRSNGFTEVARRPGGLARGREIIVFSRNLADQLSAGEQPAPRTLLGAPRPRGTQPPPSSGKPIVLGDGTPESVERLRLEDELRKNGTAEIGAHTVFVAKGSLGGFSARIVKDGQVLERAPGRNTREQAVADAMELIDKHVPKAPPKQDDSSTDTDLDANATKNPVDVEPKSRDYGQILAPNRFTIGQHFADIFDGGLSIPNINVARTIGGKILKNTVQPGSAAAKAIDEAVEIGVILAARKIVAQGREQGLSPRDIFNQLVDLYQRQPNLGVRTSTSIAQQAYSTPAPLAFLASELAGIPANGRVYEPTGGNGMLLIGTDGTGVVANELNPDRAAVLQQVFSDAHVNVGDATEYSPKLRNKVEGRDTDLPMRPAFVIANPPFGTIEGKSWPLWDAGVPTKQIDLAIVAKSLGLMNQFGNAALIIGGPSKQILASGDVSKRFYKAENRGPFYYGLYNRYNVVQHFTVAGELYEKMGAGFPVDVIIVKGRRAEPVTNDQPAPLTYPQLQAPRVFNSWEELGELLDGNANQGSLGKPDSTDTADAGGVTGGGGNSGRGPAGGAGGGSSGQGGSSGRPDAGGGQGGGGAGNGGMDRPGRDSAGKDGGTTNDQSGGGGGGTSAGGGGIQRPPGAKPPTKPDGGNGGGVQPGGVGGKPGVIGKLDPAKQEALRKLAEQMKKKLGGGDAPASGGGGVSAMPAFDPEAFTVGAQIANTLIESGIVDFETFAKAMHELAGDAVLPYIKQLYASARAGASDEIADQMTSDADVRKIKPQDLEEIVKRRDEPPEDKPDVTPPAPPPEAKIETDEDGNPFQRAYKPRSTNKTVDTLVPTNLADAIQRALDTIEAEHGDITAWVKNELQIPEDAYNDLSAEQVDALAMAIYNVQKGRGFIIGDQTGVGKGRFVAAMLHYAQKRGLVPIFVTEKKTLYEAMVRDLTDIGRGDFEPLITNQTSGADDEIKVGEGPNARVLRSIGTQHQTLSAAIDAFFETGKLNINRRGTEYKFDGIFTTYSQLQTVQGQDTARMNAMRRVASRSFFVLDESHNAGGSGDISDTRAGFIRELLGMAGGGVVYSSATFAKRASVMDLYFTTDMQLAAPDAASLAEAFEKGGVPLQQVVSAMLAEAGQYTRREKSFDGISFKTKQVEIDLTNADELSGKIGDIFDFDLYTEGIVDGMGSVGGTSAGGGRGRSAAQKSSFASVLHNLVNQVLLAEKSKVIVDEVVQALNDGQKPFIALSNTMGSFIEYAAHTLGVQAGNAVALDFRDVLLRYLRKTREYTVTDPSNPRQKIKRYLTDEQLGPAGVARYNAIADAIRKSERIKGIPASPIDHIMSQLRRRTYTDPTTKQQRAINVAEITGRKHVLAYEEDGTIRYDLRSEKESGTEGRLAALHGYNGRKGYDLVDVLVVNAAGATGLSAHASPKTGDDLRPRHMFVAQPDANIDTFMQMLGRVNRTGQVVPPAYSLLFTNMPIETRPVAVLMRKLASLNANTSANTDSNIDFKAPDFINQIGDRIVADLMAEHQDLHAAMQSPLAGREKRGGGYRPENAARRVTGRVVLLTSSEQKRLYDLILSAYKERIAQLDALGTNPLVARTLELDARSVERFAIFDGEPGNASPFSRGAYIETMNVKRLGKPYRTHEVQAQIEKALAPIYEDRANQARARMAGQGLSEKQIAAVQEVAKAFAAGEPPEIFKEALLKSGSTFNEPWKNLGLIKRQDGSVFIYNYVYKGPLLELSADGNWTVGQYEEPHKSALVVEIRPAEKDPWFYPDSPSHSRKPPALSRAQAQLAEARHLTQSYLQDETDKLVERLKKRGDLSDAEIDARVQVMRNRISEEYAFLVAFMERWTVGKPVMVIDGSSQDSFVGIITNVEHKGGAANPVANGSWKVTVAVVDASREITFSVRQTRQIGDEPADIMLTDASPDDVKLYTGTDDILEAFDNGQSASRENRFIVTGNLLAGYARGIPQGQIINFTAANGGGIRQGVLLPKNFDITQWAANRPVELRHNDQIIRFLKESNTPAQNSDQTFSITYRGGNSFRIAVPRSKTAGGIFHQDPKLVEIIRPNNPDGFVSSGQMLIADVTEAQIIQVIEHLREQGVGFFAHTAKELARRITGQAEPPKQGNSASDSPDPDNAGLPSQGNPELRERIAQRLSDQAAAPGNSPSNRPRPWDLPRSPNAAPGIVTAERIIKLMEKLGDVPIRVGHGNFKRMKALGWFRLSNYLIRMRKANELNVAAHELGHALHFRFMQWSTTIYPAGVKAELIDLGKQLYGRRKPNGGYAREGMAEYISRTMMGDTLNTPETNAWFESFVFKRNPELKEGLAELKALFKQWDEQGAIDRVSAQINRERDPLTAGLLKGWSWATSMFSKQMWTNDAAPLEKAVRRLLDDAGIPYDAIPAAKNPATLRAALSMSAAGTARHAIFTAAVDYNFLPSGKSLADALRPVRHDLEKFTVYAYARRALDLLARSIEPGISYDDARYTVRQLETPAFRAALTDVTAWSNSLIDYVVASGGLSPEAALTMRLLNPVYVPFKRYFDANDSLGKGGAGTGKGMVNQTRAVKQIKGSGRAIIDPLESLVQQAEHFFRLGNKLQVARAIIELAEHTAGSGWFANKVPAPVNAMTTTIDQLKKQLTAAGADLSNADLDQVLTVFEQAWQYHGKDNIVTIWRNGKREFWELHPDIYRVVTDMDAEYLPSWLAAIFGPPKRLVQLGATGLSAGFSLVRNPIKDAFTYLINTRDSAWHPLDGFVGLWEELSKSPEAMRWFAAGGELATIMGQDRSAAKRSLDEAVATSVIEKGVQTIKHPIDALRRLFGIFENAPRIREFQRRLGHYEALHGKGSRDALIAALLESKDVTVNFTRAGIAARALNGMIPFFNARVQGASKFYRTFGGEQNATPLLRRRAALRATSKAFLWITLPSILLWWAFKDEDWYKKRQQWEKDAFWLMSFDDGKTIIRIPKPEALGYVFGSLPVRALESQRATGGIEYDKELGNALLQFSPAKDVGDVLPAAVRPLVETSVNYDFFRNRPIDTEREVRDKLPQDRFNDNTTEAAKKLAQMLAPIMGVSPKRLEHLAGGYTGGIGLDVMRWTDTMAKPERRENATLSDMPGVGTLFARDNAGNSQYEEDLYSRIEVLRQNDGSTKLPLLEKFELQRLNAAAKEIGELRRMRERPGADHKALGDRMDQIARRALNR